MTPAELVGLTQDDAVALWRCGKRGWPNTRRGDVRT